MDSGLVTAGKGPPGYKSQEESPSVLPRSCDLRFNPTPRSCGRTQEVLGDRVLTLTDGIIAVVR